MNKRNRPTEITDAPEHRSTQRFEVRDDTADTITLEGYASTFEPYEMYGGPAAGGWIEQLATTAFDKTLREKPDLHLLINHEGMPLARTKSGTLQLSTDNHGLKVRSELDRSDPDVQRLEPKMRRKDMDEMSFAFRVKSQTWSAAEGFDDDPMSHRMINEVSLHKGDVSVVNFGANDTTHAEIKSIDQAIELLAMCAPEQLIEARSAGGDDLIQRAQAALDMLTRGRSTTVVDLGKRGGVGGPGGESFATSPVGDGEAKAAPDDAPKPEPTGEDKTEQKPTGRKLLTRREAMRRQGFGSEDGSLMTRQDGQARQERDGEAVEALRATGASHDALLAKLSGAS